MSRTWKDMQISAERQKQALEARYRKAIAREKARHEVLLALTSGKLDAKQVKGSTYFGKVPGMAHRTHFDLNVLISLRAEQPERQAS